MAWEPGNLKTDTNTYDVGVKSPNYDAYGLFRALHSHNPFYAPLRSVLNMCHWHIAPQYSHIVKLTLHFYAHIGAGH